MKSRSMPVPDGKGGNPGTKQIVSSVGKEIRDNPPSVLAKTRRNKGAKAAERQRKAILLSKARSKGANV